MNFKTELLKNILFKGFNVLLSFVVTILLVRLFGTEGNGLYSLFIANTAIISLIVSFSFTSGIIYYTAKNEFNTGALFNTMILILLIQLIVIMVAEKIFRSIFGFSFYVNVSFPGLAFWGIVYLMATLLNGCLSAVFTGRKWFDTLNLLTVVTNVIFVITFVALFIERPDHSLENTVTILKVYISIVALQSLVSLLVLVKKLKLPFQFTFLKISEAKKIFAYSGIAFFSNFFQFLAYRMDYWFIDIFRNKEELGLYALASKLNQVLWMLPITVAAVIIPFAATSSSEVTYKVKIILRVLFNSYIFLGIILVFTSPIFIPLIFGKSFSGTVLPFIILLPGVIIFSLTTVLAAFFAGINRQSINLKISFFCFLFIFLGDLILVPSLGKEGAAMASCFGYAFSGICSLWIFSKQSGYGFKELLLLQKKDIGVLKNIFSVKYP